MNFRVRTLLFFCREAKRILLKFSRSFPPPLTFLYKAKEKNGLGLLLGDRRVFYGG
ncbi:hypothetical protein BH24BAC1_BH24BAC1_07340 [soil metagenome]